MLILIFALTITLISIFAVTIMLISIFAVTIILIWTSNFSVTLKLILLLHLDWSSQFSNRNIFSSSSSLFSFEIKTFPLPPAPRMTFALFTLEHILLLPLSFSIQHSHLFLPSCNFFLFPFCFMFNCLEFWSNIKYIRKIDMWYNYLNFRTIQPWKKVLLTRTFHSKVSFEAVFCLLYV